MRLGAAQRTESFVCGAPDQRLEAEPYRLGVRPCARRGSGVLQEPLIHVHGLLHTSNYAICVWLYLHTGMTEPFPKAPTAYFLWKYVSV